MRAMGSRLRGGLALASRACLAAAILVVAAAARPGPRRASEQTAFADEVSGAAWGEAGGAEADAEAGAEAPRAEAAGAEAGAGGQGKLAPIPTLTPTPPKAGP